MIGGQTKSAEEEDLPKNIESELGGNIKIEDRGAR